MSSTNLGTETTNESERMKNTTIKKQEGIRFDNI
jgi:hypothetical protein